jgi:hypothetical protein
MPSMLDASIIQPLSLAVEARFGWQSNEALQPDCVPVTGEPRSVS